MISDDIHTLTEEQVNIIRQWCNDEVQATVNDGFVTIKYNFEKQGTITMVDLAGVTYKMLAINLVIGQFFDHPFNIFNAEPYTGFYIHKDKSDHFKKIWDQLNSGS